MSTELLTQRAAAMLEAAEAMVSLLRDHQDEIARGEAPHVFTALDAYVELQESAQALRLHFDSPAEVSAFDALVAMHGLIREYNPHAYFELAYTRGTGWMAWICDRPGSGTPGTVEWNLSRKVLTSGQGETTDEACEAALEKLTIKPADISASEIPY